MHKNTVYRPYRLGLDVGSNSLGWFVIWLDELDNPSGLGPGGVRIYPDGRDPKSKSSNAVDRRLARGARRRRDRYLRRRSGLMSLLVQHELMPAQENERKALEVLDPYELRAHALDSSLPLHHVGRAIFHLNQRRGFSSNRKTTAKESEDGAIKIAAGKLQQLMQEEGARTLGEFFYSRHVRRESVRSRNVSTSNKAEYDFYPTRQLLLNEFDAIWKYQAIHHPEMTDEAYEAIHEVIFYQRPLKAQQVGKCSLSPAQPGHDIKEDLEGYRCPWAHPLAQRFRIWQEVRNLAIQEAGRASRSLSKEQGDIIALALFQNNKLSFDKMRSLLKIPSDARFNLESEKRKELKGDETAEKLSHKNLFHKSWRSFELKQQIEIVTHLLDDENEDELIEWLITTTGIDAECAARVAGAFLPESHSRLGLRAIKAILPHMEAGMNYPDATKAAGWDHAKGATGEILDRLPYYGEWLQDDVLGTGDPDHPDEKRWGRFPNPTVHIGLGQIRRVVNSLIDQYGPPAYVTVEMTRDFKNSPDQIREIEKEQAANQRRNEDRAEKLRGLGLVVNAGNLLRLRLWEELNPKDPLDRRCPYSGEIISIERLFSNEVEVDHLIPFSISWDDSAANKIVCMRHANRAKGNRTPYDAFGSSPHTGGWQYDWADLSLRSGNLPKNKVWRFAPDAMNRFQEKGGFQARQLNETGWLARVTQHYLTAVTGPYKVNVLPGKMTAIIRGKWGLNTLLPDHNFSDAKNRKDHRHHAIDAMVAALTDRSLLQRMSSAYDEERQRIEIPLPWEGLRDDLDARLKTMIVSHKPEHGVQAQLHEDTAYGTVRHPEKEDGATIVYRKGFLSLSEKEICRIRDLRLRALVADHVESEKNAGIDFRSAILSFSKRTDIPGLPHGIRHVRLTKVENPKYMVPVRNSAGKAYKSYSAGENAFIDILEDETGKWIGENTSVFQANQHGWQPEWMKMNPRPRFIMRIFKGDLLNIEDDGGSRIVRVVKLEPSKGRFSLVEHYDAGSFQTRNDDAADPFRWIYGAFNKLKEWKAVRVRVDGLGRPWRVLPEEGARSLLI